MSVMTTATRRTSEAATRARSAVERSTELWKQNAYSLSDQTRRFPNVVQIDLIPAAEQYFDFVRRTVDINRKFAIKWLETANTLSAAAAEQVESVGTLMRDRLTTLMESHRPKPKRPKRSRRTWIERSASLSVAGHAGAREGRRTIRVSDQGRAQRSAGRGGLPKTGNVDELIERLVEADEK